MPARETRDAEIQSVSSSVGQAQVTPELSRQRAAVELVMSDFASAKTARDQRNYGQTAKGEQLSHDQWLKELRDLYYGYRIPKTVPWKYCSNRSLMIGMAILEVLHARLFPAIYNEELTHYRPTEHLDQEKAERVDKFMFWWARVHCKLRDFFDRWTRYAIGFGTVVTVTSWDVRLIDRGRVKPPEQTVNPDGTVTVTPQEKELDREEKSRSDIIPLSDVYFQPGLRDVQRDTVVIERTYLYRDLEEMERDGKIFNVTIPTTQGVRTLREMIPLPAMQSEGMSQEEVEELRNIQRRNVSIKCLEWWGGIDIDHDSYPEQMRLLIVPEWRILLGAIELKDISRRGLRPLDATLFAPRLDEPSGQIGIGVLEQVKELALEIDAIFNQMTDANSISILRPIFYDPHGDIDASALSLAPNKMTPVPRPNESIHIPQIDIRTEQLLLAIRMVLEFIERVTAASAYIMGKESEIVGGSGTATRTEAIVGASNQRHAIPVQRLRDGAARILTQHLDLVMKRAQEPDGFMQMMEKRVMGERGQPVFVEGELETMGVTGEYDCYLLPDESMGSKEAERNLVMMLYQLALGNPIIATDAAKLYKVTADVYKAYGKNPEEYLGIAPDVKQTDRPDDENTLILQGDLASVQASVLDNHIEHILIHQELLKSPVFLAYPPDIQAGIQQFLTAHIQQHMELMSMMMKLPQSQPQQNGGSGGANGNGKVGGRPSPANRVGPEPGMGSVQSPLARTSQTKAAGDSAGSAGSGGF